jgi:hypothetical protein
VGSTPDDEDDILDDALEELSPPDRAILCVLRQAVQDLRHEQERARVSAARFLWGDGMYWAGYLGFDVGAWARTVEQAWWAAGNVKEPPRLPPRLDRQPIIFRGLQCSRCGLRSKNRHALALHWSVTHPHESLVALDDAAQWVEEDRRRRLHILAVARGIHPNSVHHLLRRVRLELKSKKTG